MAKGHEQKIDIPLSPMDFWESEQSLSLDGNQDEEFEVVSDDDDKEEDGEEDAPFDEAGDDLDSDLEDEASEDKDNDADADADKEEEEEEEEEASDVIEEDLNPSAVIAEHWKEKGILPEDFEITEDFSAENLNDVLYKATDESRRQQIVNEYLEEQGLSRDHIELKKRDVAGITEEDDAILRQYAQLSRAKLDSESENYEEDLQVYFENFYYSTGMPAEKIKELAEADVQDEENHERNIKLAAQHFAKKTKEISAEIEEKLQTWQQSRRKKEDEYRGNVERMLKEPIEGIDYDEKQQAFIKNAFFNKSEVVRVGGTDKRVTLLEKKILEFNQDMPKTLNFYISLLLGDQINEKKKARTEKSILDKLNQSSNTKSRSLKRKNKKKTKNIQKSPVDTTIVEF